MKMFSTVDVKTDGSVRVKRRTVVFTGQPGSSNINKEDELEEVTSNHITVDDLKELDLETAKKRRQATVDDLKELDLETAEKRRQATVDDLKELDLKTAEKRRQSM